jgi:hypothetical protein
MHQILKKSRPVERPDQSRVSIKTDHPKLEVVEPTSKPKPGTVSIQWVPTAEVKIVKPFSTLFPDSLKMRERIKNQIAGQGFDYHHPLIVDRESMILVDGRIRLEVACELKLLEVPVCFLSLPTEADKIRQAIKSNLWRRTKMTDATWLNLVELTDQKLPRGGDRRSPETQSISRNRENDTGVDSSKWVADLLGIGKSKVQQCRKIIGSGDSETRAQVCSGQLSINRAYNRLISNPSSDGDKERSGLYRVKSPIGLAKWGWDVFPRDEKGVPDFSQERLGAIKQAKLRKTAPEKARRVLVSPNINFFDPRIKPEWINEVLSTIREDTAWTFIILTDYPDQAVDFEYPKNAWLGVNINAQDQVEPAEEAFRQISIAKTFIWVTGCSERLTFENLKAFDWIVIGGTEGAFRPTVEWLGGILSQASKAGIPVYPSPGLKVQGDMAPPK